MSGAIDRKVPGYSPDQGFSVIRADTDDLRACVFRLRYYVYVTIMQRRQIHADHRKMIIREPMDENGISYLALKNGMMIGTVRRNLLSDPTASYYSDVYRAHLFDTGRAARVALTTKLMMIPEYQGSPLSLKLITEYAAHSYADGVAVDLIDCNEHLVPFFERFGYFTHTGWSVHKEYGRVMPMFFAADTIRYLQLIGSPFATVGSKYVTDGQYGGYELVRRLAHPPTLDTIRAASHPLRNQLQNALV